jgi:hypothetical protein
VVARIRPQDGSAAAVPGAAGTATARSATEEAGEGREAEEAGEAGEGREAEEAGEGREAEEVEEAGDTGETVETVETVEARETVEAGEAEKAGEAEEDADAATPRGVPGRAASAVPADVTTSQLGPHQSASTSQAGGSGWDVISGMEQQSTPARPVSSETPGCVPGTTVRNGN